MTLTGSRLTDPDFLRYVAETATPQEREYFGKFLAESLEARQYDWSARLRPEQKWPKDVECDIEIKLAGRGFGKTLGGCVWLRDEALATPDTRWFVAAPTFGDVRDTCFEGETGLLKVTLPSKVKTYNRSLGELVFVNGSRIKGFSGDEPDRFRGPQHHGGLWEELAAFRYAQEAWDQAQFGLRLGSRPKQMITTTPRPTKLIRSLLARSDVHVTRGSTFDNAANLAPTMLAKLKRQYENTRLGRQELMGELLEDVPGALATLEELDACRVTEEPEPVRTVVAVDPAITDTDESDETGITVLSRGEDGHCYMLYDYSCRASVNDWARRVVTVAMSDEVQAGMILYEKNQGADAIGSVLRNACRELGANNIVLKDVTASKSKFDRALPLQQWIQQNRFHLVGSFPQLEEQLATFTADSKTSPDRLDSCVHGFSELMLSAPKPRMRFRG